MGPQSRQIKVSQSGVGKIREKETVMVMSPDKKGRPYKLFKNDIRNCQIGIVFEDEVNVISPIKNTEWVSKK